ncbi:MAG: hypothetical protein CMH64_02650 [Nanoarchaeota archaeon]|nr:hypothetical protein [Nanoarchaeota archaeon]|tara:strand:+ start:519 stop:1250 length:732 start_codon:yes stop_codon:yes gene_type:complete
MDRINFNIKNLEVSYKNFNISGINLKLQNGDIIGLLGRSGCGKSTLIKALLGIKDPLVGEMQFLVDNKPTPIKEFVGYSAQHNSLYPFLTVEENLMTFGRLQNVKKSEIETRTKYLLKRLDLYNSREKRITQLSGGMAKRADLAVALIHNPSILILDEPFSGLDVSIKNLIWNMIQEFAKEGRIVIVSSHSLADVQKYCNKYGLIINGLFYSTNQLIRAINNTKEKSFELFIEGLFKRALVNE